MIKIYFSDGTPVGEKGNLAESLRVVLRSDMDETSSPIRLYTEADEGYEIENVTVELVSANGAATTSQWRLAPDSNNNPGTWEGWGDPLALGNVGHGSGERVYFWVQARSSEQEGVKNDATVILEASGVALEVLETN